MPLTGKWNACASTTKRTITATVAGAASNREEKCSSSLWSSCFSSAYSCTNSTILTKEVFMQKSLDRAIVARDFALQWRRIVGLASVTFASRGSAFSCAYKGSAAHGIVLVRSSDFWEYRLHLPGKQSA